MKAIRIMVCVKQVPDPEAPFSAVRLDSKAKRFSVMGLPPVINPYDQNALEAALRIKEETGGRITVLSMGERLSEPILRNTLAVGADELVLLRAPAFADLDSLSTARVLSTAIRKIGEYDVILAGRQAGDWDSGQTGFLLGEMLGIPIIALAAGVEVAEGKAVVKRLVLGGYERVESGLPVLITVSNEAGELRYASLPRMLEARKRQIEIWGQEDLELGGEDLQGMGAGLVDLLPPQDMKRECRFMEGDSAEEKGKNLARNLKEMIAELG